MSFIPSKEILQIRKKNIVLFFSKEIKERLANLEFTGGMPGNSYLEGVTAPNAPFREAGGK
jgi:hypothetical protein